MSDQTFFLERLCAPAGTVLLLTDAEGRVRALDWDDYEERMHRLLRLHYGDGVRLAPRGGASAARRALEAYFGGDLGALDRIETATGGTPFQRSVWAALRAIPTGATATYGEVAKQIGRPKAVRAVGAANGANPIGIIVPCHRVVGADGTLTGYGGGLERKQWLLDHERGGRTPPA